MSSAIKCAVEGAVCSVLDIANLSKPVSGTFPRILGSGIIDFPSQINSDCTMEAPYLMMTLSPGTPLVSCFERYGLK